jgi:hypothetical protein
MAVVELWHRAHGRPYTGEDLRPRSNPKAHGWTGHPPCGPLAIGRGDGRHFSAYFPRTQSCMRSSDSIHRRSHSTDQLGAPLAGIGRHPGRF